MKTGNTGLQMPLNKLKTNPKNPRHVSVATADASLIALSESVKRLGVLQPILIRPSGEIVAGHRRFVAAQLAKLETVPVLVLDCADNERSEVVIAENLHRQDLTPLQIASLFKEMANDGLSVSKIANVTSITPATVSRYLSIFKLPERVWPLVDNGVIAIQSAEQVSKLSSLAQREELCDRIIAEELTAKQVSGVIAAGNALVIKPKNAVSYEAKRQQDIAWALEKLMEVERRLEPHHLNGKTADALHVVESMLADAKERLEEVQSAIVDWSIQENKETRRGHPTAQSNGHRVDPLFEEIAKGCRIDWHICTVAQRNDINQTTGILRKAGRSPEDVRRVVQWWFASDWRGRKGQAPRPSQLREVWQQAFSKNMEHDEHPRTASEQNFRDRVVSEQLLAKR